MKRKPLYPVVMAVLIFGMLLLTGCTSKKEKISECLLQGKQLMASGDYYGALEQFSTGLETSNGDISDTVIDLVYYKAAALYLLEDYTDAIDCYTALMDYNADDGYAAFLRGCLYADMNQKDDAVNDFNEAISRNSSDYDLYIAIYEELNYRGYSDLGLNYLNQALEIEGDGAENNISRGRIYKLMGQYDTALIALQKAVDKGSQDAGIYMAEIYELQGNTEQAEAILDSYRNDSDITPSAANAIAELEMNRGNYEEAYNYTVTGLEKATGINRRNLLKTQVASLEKLGNYEEALEVAGVFINEFPGDDEMLNEMAFLSTR